MGEGVSELKITKRKHPRSGEFWLTPLFLRQTRVVRHHPAHKFRNPSMRLVQATCYDGNNDRLGVQVHFLTSPSY